MRQRYSVAQHRAAPAGGTQLAAQFLGTGTALCADVDPRPTYAAAREPVVQDAWLPPAQDGRVPLLKLMIGGERRRIQGASDNCTPRVLDCLLLGLAERGRIDLAAGEF